MTASLKETRRHRRFTVEVEAIVHTPQAPGGRLTARTRDVSRSGICLVTSTALATGERAVIELVLAFGENRYSEPLKLGSHVVWCTPIANSFQVGVMFDDLSDEQDTYLEMFMHFLDGTLAPKGDGEQEPEPELTPPPDIKDDPFR